VDGPGAFFRPAAITGITPDVRVYSEEAFGPLAMIYRVPDADAAVALANSSKCGLGGMVFSEDFDEARREAGQLDTGGVGINKSRPTVSPDHERLDREATPLRASLTRRSSGRCR
jgi:succinate-semialdehyde dehydrogenase/glutarate-semialdehyde dehydrogenase